MLVLSFSVNVSADNEQNAFSIESALIDGENNTLNVSCTLPDVSSDDTYYLFRVMPDSYSITNLTPVAEAQSNNGRVIFTLPYDYTDHSLSLYGYVLATAKSDGGYVALTKAKYIDNLTDFSHTAFDYQSPKSKKGLEVQYITDAQLLGISSTVVHVSLNALISEEEGDDTVSFVYGETKYHLNKSALTLLDYRIKTLTDAGIHVYMNLILTFDNSAPSFLYYPNAEGSTSTLFAPNVSTPKNIGYFASTIHYLAERYSGQDHGFCGSYIIGYEVNNEADSNSAGFTSLKEYTQIYSAFLRTAYLSTITAYSGSRVFVSLSNQWNLPTDTLKPCQFGGKEFLSELSTVCNDIPFGIAINPYPSSLTQTAFWNDDKAIDSADSEYLTMKNLSVLTNMLNDPEFQFNNRPRQVLISEFGVSGSYGEPSESLQAAAYAYAYLIAESEPLVEGFIWHRHVDHVSEIGLDYGLYSSSEITLDGKDKKLIHSIMSDIDLNDKERTKTLDKILSYLPFKNAKELFADLSSYRTVINVSPSQSSPSSISHKKVTVFDLSQSLYSFYPSDNTEYIDTVKEGDEAFMRIATIPVSQVEYMGASISVKPDDIAKGVKYVGIRMRVVSPDPQSTVCVLMSGLNDGKSASLVCSSELNSNEWVNVIVPLSSFDIDSDTLTVKLWVRSDSSRNERLFIDVSSVDAYSQKNILPIVIIIILISIAILVPLGGAVYVIINKHSKRSLRK